MIVIQKDLNILQTDWKRKSVARNIVENKSAELLIDNELVIHLSNFYFIFYFT